MRSCPSSATLARLVLDPSGGETPSTLEDHIAGCPNCQSALDRLVQNDAADPEGLDIPPQDSWPRLPGFVIERELGRGSAGVVYLASQPNLDRWVALKVVRSGTAAGSREHARWLREARSFSKLRHENVVRLHEIGEAEGWLYLVLEYIPGGTLSDRLKVPYAPIEAARLMAPIAEAVDAIHREGLLHRDLKPSNILMDAFPDAPREQATPKVGDFGLAFAWQDEPTVSGTVGTGVPVGSPGYMAPEQVNNRRDRLSPATDVHGLGALLYHAITGRPPFAAPSVAESLDQIRHRDPVPPRRLNPGIPRDLETICLKCLRKDPTRRYETAGVLADDLRRFVNGLPIAARPISRLEKAARCCRRYPTVAALAMALIVAIWGGFVGMFVLWLHAEAQRGRAEAYLARAAELLGELIDLNAGGAGGQPRYIDPNRKILLLRGARRHLVGLAEQLPDRRSYYTQLMAVDQGLSDVLDYESRRDERRDLLLISLRDAEEARRRFPRDGFARDWQFWAIYQLTEVADGDGNVGVVESLIGRTIELAKEAYTSVPGPAQLTCLIDGRLRRADYLAAAGRIDEVRGLLQDNRRTLAEVPRDRVDLTVILLRTASPIYERQFGIQLPPWPGPTGGLGSTEADRLPPEAWAEAAARSLGLDAPDGPTASAPSMTTLKFAESLQRVATIQRRRKQLARARQSANRLMALAERMLRRRPHDPFTYLLLAAAHEQANKNAWQEYDDPAIDPARKPAVWANIVQTMRDCARADRTAMELDPDNFDARKQFQLHQRKLEKLLHP